MSDNERRETHAEVIAEMREIHVAEFQDYADRLEAAHGRELAASGNAAKLREALERVLCWLKRMNAEPLDALAVSEFTPSYAVNRTAKSIIEDNDYHISQITAALVEPPRNCDRFASVDEARKAHEAICEKYGKCHHGCPLNNEEHYSAFDCFEAWLFAPATEKEGGADV